MRKPDFTGLAAAGLRRVVAYRAQTGPSSGVREVVAERGRELLRVLDPDWSGGRTGDPIPRVRELLENAPIDRIWLAMTTLRGEFPQAHEVVRLFRVGALRDGDFVLGEILSGVQLQARPAKVRIADGEVLVDVFHTSLTHLATGIQRVTREVTKRWAAEHDLTLVGWTEGHRGLRELTPAERETTLFGRPRKPVHGPDLVVVPWRGVYLVPELIADFQRSLRNFAMIRYSGCRTGAIGHDCIPLTTAETIDSGMGGHFAGWLASAREMDVVATTCESSRREYEGWKRMLVGVGVEGPQIKDVLLPADIPDANPQALERMRLRMTIPGFPTILCVGSHEPRKNHLAVLHAAELLWREGLDFSLVFIGGKGWHGEAFVERVEELEAAGRTVQSLTGIGDEDLFAAYRIADFSIFPSLNEGFGLPVVESLAVGTPVITSAFGSMAEIAAGGGALLVDPRDDEAIADGMRRLLTDPALRAELSGAALGRPERNWEDYARETWDVLVNGGEDSA